MRLLTKTLTVISMLGGLTAGTQVLAEPFKVGVCYDLSKAYTFAAGFAGRVGSGKAHKQEGRYRW